MKPLKSNLFDLEEQKELLAHDDDSNAASTDFVYTWEDEGTRGRYRRWVATAAQYGAVIVLSMAVVALFPSLNLFMKLSSLGRGNVCPTMWTPVKHAVRYTVDTPSFDYWASDLYSGPPSAESDFAWNDLLHPHGFRLTQQEAQRLNISQSIMLPGGDFSSIAGVIHNLHCLRRLRQTIYSDYYYANLTEKQREHNVEHNQHCIESLRTSLMCHPDLTFYPYYWSGNPDHNLNPRPDTQRECVDWQALFPALRVRQYDYSLLDKTIGWVPGLAVEEKPESA